MRVVVIDGCCKAEDLHVTDIPIPQTRPGWVLVRVRAAGLNHSEAVLRMYEADSGYINTPIVPGIECVGEIADASDSGLHKGDRVVALMGGMGRSYDGSYAEYALLPASNVFKVNTELDWLSMAAVPETYYTAYGSLTECSSRVFSPTSRRKMPSTASSRLWATAVSVHYIIRYSRWMKLRRHTPCWSMAELVARLS